MLYWGIVYFILAIMSILVLVKFDYNELDESF